MELHLAKGTVLIEDGKDPKTKKVRYKRKSFDRVIVTGSTEAEWRASFKYHKCFTREERLKAKQLEATGKLHLETIESVCRLGL